MATSSIRPRRPRCFSAGCLPLVLLCLAWLVAWDLRQSFVQGLRQWHGPEGQVRERLSQNCALSGKAEDVQAEARKLTSSLKKATAKKLIEILDEAVDEPIFDFIHASAAYTQLVTLKRRKGVQKRDWEHPVLLRLHARVEDMMLNDQLNAQASANVMWSIAQLSDRFSVPTKLLIALVKSLPTKVKTMDEQNLSNSLWASAKLKEVAHDVLEVVPAIVAEIPKKAKDMVPQALSNCLWASAQLKDVAPDVLEVVPAIVAQIPNKAKDMKPQELSNCLFACAQLKDEVPQVLEIVPAIVAEIPSKIQDMNGQDLANNAEALVFLQESGPEVDICSAGGGMDEILSSTAKRLNTLLPGLRGKDLSLAATVVVWACAKAEVYDGELLDSVARRLGSRTKLSSVPAFNLCALSWSYQVLDTGDVFIDFRKLLTTEAERRGFSEADVESCKRGRFQWNHAS